MAVRALFVFLLVFNAGVALWWALREPPPLSPPTTASALPPGVARLQLVGDAPSAVTATTSSPGRASAPVADAALPAAARCFSFGPFSSDQAAVAAQVRLQRLAQHLVVREERRGTSRGWRVVVPPLPDAEQAAATAQRIGAAGFTDYFVLREGSDANAIALGRYGNEAAARRHAESLVAAGFAARAESLGGMVTWIDVSPKADFDAAAAQGLAAAPERRELDCAKLR